MFKKLLIVSLLLQGFLFLAYAQQETFTDPAPEKVALVDKARYKTHTEHPFVLRHHLVAPVKGMIAGSDMQKVVFNFFADAKYTVTLHKVDAEGVTNMWTGTVDNVAVSSVEVFYDGENIEGKIDVGNRLFSFSRLDGLILVREIDKNTMPGFGHDQKYPPK